MPPLQKSMTELRLQLQKGMIQIAYKGLLDYILSLRNYFAKKYPDYQVSGSPYQGYMDMTYFSFTPPALKLRGLKIAVVFVYETFRFEVWLAAVNKRAQTDYWKAIQSSGWDGYHLSPSTQGYDAIIEHPLAENPDFSAPVALTQKIEEGTLQFIADVEDFLGSSHPRESEHPINFGGLHPRISKGGFSR